MMLPPLKGARSIAHRRVEPKDSLEYFPTPPWATRALMEHVLGPRRTFRRLVAHEPACGEGHMAAVLAEYFGTVIASDVFPYGYGEVRDFLDEMFTDPIAADWIVTNPPFEKGEEFAHLMVERARLGAALFVRSTFLETKGRYSRLFSRRPPSIIAQFAERVPLHKGRWEPDGDTATAYCWIVWHTRPQPGRRAGETRFQWIPFSRQALTRAGDVERFGAPKAAAPSPMFGV